MQDLLPPLNQIFSYIPLVPEPATILPLRLVKVRVVVSPVPHKPRYILFPVICRTEKEPVISSTTPINAVFI
jgi:hypothetical protein